jgi:hypothetical protein
MKDIPPFKNMDHPREYFETIKKVYYEDPSMKLVIIIYKFIIINSLKLIKFCIN